MAKEMLSQLGQTMEEGTVVNCLVGSAMRSRKAT